MEIRFARSATKHRISRDRARFVIEHAGRSFRLPPRPGVPDEARRLIYLGDDSEGNALEVIAVPTNTDGVVVIHAMNLREKHRGRYEEAMKWAI